MDSCALSIVMRMSVSPQDSEPIILSTADNNGDTAEATPDDDSGKSHRGQSLWKSSYSLSLALCVIRSNFSITVTVPDGTNKWECTLIKIAL